MIEILQQIWFPVTAMVAVIVMLVFALNQRSRRRRAMQSRQVYIMPAEHRDEDRLS